MKKRFNLEIILKIVLIICSIVVVFSFIYIIKSLYIDGHSTVTMKAIILEVGDVLNVAEIESGTFKEFNVEYKTISKDKFKKGQELLLIYSGMVTDMPYPSYFIPYKIKVLKDESEIKILENVLIDKHTL